MTVDTHDALERKAKKERKKLRKLDLSTLSNEEDTALMSGDKRQETTVEEKKTKRKDKRKKKDHLNGSDIAHSGSEGTSKKKSKRKKDGNASETQLDIEDAATELQESTGDVALSAKTSREEVKREKKKDRQRSEEGEEEAAETKKKKKKKRKREEDGTSYGKEGDSEVPKKKKKRKPQNEATGLRNPSGDTALTDQTRKALVYAYAQIDDPPSWKFNKARQNWLIRNIWSESAIPEIYEPILTRYLVGIQGGVRDNLVKLCQSTLEPAQDSSVQVAPSEDADKSLIGSTSQQENAGLLTSVETSSLETVKRRRARAILDVLNTPES